MVIIVFFQVNQFTLLSREIINAFFVNFRVEPDPSKAVNLSVTFDSKAPCVVGELLPGKRSWKI